MNSEFTKHPVYYRYATTEEILSVEPLGVGVYGFKLMCYYNNHGKRLIWESHYAKVLAKHRMYRKGNFVSAFWCFRFTIALKNVRVHCEPVCAN